MQEKWPSERLPDRRLLATSRTQSLRGGAVLGDGEIQVLVLPSGAEEVVVVD